VVPRIGPNRTRRRAARHRRRPCLSAGASMSRLCAPKSPQTPRPHGSASSAARLRTARGGRSQSSACPGLAKRGAQAPRPKRGRNARDVRTLASAADAPLSPVRVGASPIPSGPSERAAPKDASGRRARTIRNPGVGLNGQMPGSVMADRPSAVSTVPRGEAKAIVANVPRERGTAPIRRANASLTGPRAGRAPRPARADRHDRTPGMTDRRSAASTAPQRKVTAIIGSALRERGTPPPRRANASLTGPKACRALKPARADRHVQSIGNLDIGLSGQMPQGVIADRRSVASTAPQRVATVIIANVARERGTAPIRRANASLTGPKAGRVPQPAKADRHVRTPRAAARARTSNQDRRAQGRVTEIGRRAPAEARAAKAGRRAAARFRSGGLAHRGRDRRKAAAARAGRRENREARTGAFALSASPVPSALGRTSAPPLPKGRPGGRPSLDGLWGEGRVRARARSAPRLRRGSLIRRANSPSGRTGILADALWPATFSRREKGTGRLYPRASA
jgi:hypothetical protein